MTDTVGAPMGQATIVEELRRTAREREQRRAELMTLNELGLALSSTLDLTELLDRSLRAIVGHLRFERALVLLADPDRGVLGGGRSIGGTTEMVALVNRLEVPLDDPDSALAALYRADGPLLIRNMDEDPSPGNRDFAKALEVTSFVGTPLVTKDRHVGVLAVDSGSSGRDVEPGDGPLLFTIGTLIASAVEAARLYAELEAQNRELERRVAERTESLARATEAAERARAAAEAASAAKGRFLTSVSHELRTPLSSVVGFTKIIRKRLDEVVFPSVVRSDPRVDRAIGQIGENLAIIVAEGDRLTAMINDVLDLAKIEAGRMDWKRQEVAMGELVERAARATSALVGAAGLRLELDVEPGLPAVVGDPDRLLQVVINLLANAVKFTPAGSVSCRAQRHGEEILVSVIDTGVGIDPADHAAVFEQFRQVGDTLTDKPRGTGLGLPICRQIVEHHGGRLWLAQSAPGQGSVFAFSLPLASDR